MTSETRAMRELAREMRRQREDRLREQYRNVHPSEWPGEHPDWGSSRFEPWGGPKWTPPDKRRSDRIDLTRDEILNLIDQDQREGGSGSKARVARLAHCSVSTLKRRWREAAPGEEWPSDRSPEP